MLSALGWQRKGGLHEGIGYIEIQSEPPGVLGMIGGTPVVPVNPLFRHGCGATELLLLDVR